MKRNKRESDFQRDLKNKLYKLFPGCIILKNDPNSLQGFPDLTIMWKGNTAVLECKKFKNANYQLNQDYYINRCKDECTYSNFIYPENEEEVLNDLQRAFKSDRSSFISKS